MKFYTVITSKGTATIPSRVRRELDIKPGDIVEFDKDNVGNSVISKLPNADCRNIRKPSVSFADCYF